MTKKEARDKAIDYLHEMSDDFELTMHITCNSVGYTSEECVEIKKQLDFLMKRIFTCDLKKTVK